MDAQLETPRGLVGRRSELGELTAAFESAAHGRGALFVVSGEAGIGKTRLVGELVARAEAEGARAIWSAAWDGGGAPAYWPWIQIVRRLADAVPPETLRARAGSGAPYLGQIVPELRDALPDLPDVAAAESEQARFGLFDALSRFLHASATERPLVLVFDDVHAADQASLLAVEFLARTLHDAAVLAVLTLRTGEEHDLETAALLAGIMAAPTAHTIPIGGLSRAELEQLVAAQVGGRAAPVEQLHALTGGNPFFTNEVVRLLAAEGLEDAGAEAHAPAALPLPESVRDTIRRRLQPLPGEAVDVLSIAAVIGYEFRLNTLAAASGRDQRDLLEILDAAIASGTVREVPHAIGRYAFTHALIRETLYEDLPKTHRARLHGTVAEALERIHGDTAELSELAEHFFRSASVGDPRKALDYAVRAGEQAMEILAYEHAQALYTRALRALELLEPSDDRRRCELLLACGNAQMGGGDVAGARETLERAAAIARRLDLPEHLARAALGSAPWGLATTMFMEDLADLFEEALRRVPQAERALRARLLAALGVARYWSASAQERLALVEQAIAIARDLNDPGTLARVLADAHIATWDPDSPARSMPWAKEILALSDEAGDIELALYAHDWRIALLLETGDIARAERAIAKFERLAEEAHQPRARNYARRHKTLRALMDGRYADAERLLDEAARTADLREGSIEALLLSGQAFAMRWSQGRLGELERAVRHFAERYPAMPAWRCALIAVYIDTGRDADARREFDRFAANDFADLPYDNLWLAALVFLTEACARLRDTRSAAVLARLLEPFADRNVVIPAGVTFGPVSRYLGLLASTLGQTERAVEHFTAAREAAIRMGAPPMVAQLCVDQARALIEAGREHEAVALLAEAEPLAGSLGLARVERELEELGARLEGTAQPAEPQPDTPGAPAQLVREGDYWRVAYEGGAFMLKDSKGMRYLARLLAEPDTEIHALDLVGAPRDRAASIPTDAGALLDPEAKAAYKARLEELREDVEQAEEWSDPERAAGAREEMEFLTRELARAVGLGGRDRKAASDAERARVNATRAIKGVVQRVGAEDERLARHLENCVATGTFCAYRPEPDAPRWKVMA